MAGILELPRPAALETNVQPSITHWKPWAIAAALLIGVALLAVKFMPEGGGPSYQGPLAGNGAPAEDKNTEPAEPKPDEHRVSLSRQTGPDFSFAKYYPKADEAPKASVKQYALPLNVEEIANAAHKRVEALLSNPEAAALLKANGFVVDSKDVGTDFAKTYENLTNSGVPIIVTPDTVLHLFHICFDETLKDLEEEVFAWDMLDVTKTLLDDQIQKLQAEYELAPDNEEGVKRRYEAIRMNVAYLSVAYKLLGEIPRKRTPEIKDRAATGVILESNPDTVTIHNDVKDLVNAELDLMDKHEGFKVSPIFGYKEDYSQYVPRGHYTRSELLKRYFKAMMWFGRMTFLCNEIPGNRSGQTVYADTEKGVTREMADVMTTAASSLAEGVITLPLGDVKPRPDFAMALSGAESATVMQLWQRVYSATAFFVGAADDLTPMEFHETLKGEKSDALISAETLRTFQAGLDALPLPKIYGGTAALVGDIRYGTPTLAKALEYTKGLRLMGQRYVPDSEAMGRLVFPTVDKPFKDERGATKDNLTWVMSDAGPIRGFPRGLDVMALMGSKRAGEILHELKDNGYEGYKESFEILQGQFARLSDADWNQNLYFGWLNTLRPLLTESSTRSGYPTFMQTRNYEDRLLTATLASWAQLRHDTILYAKQSYTMMAKGGKLPAPPRIVGLVEPLPEFYGRMNRLCVMMTDGLNATGMLSKRAGDRLAKLAQLSKRLDTISRQELEAKELSEEDYDFIKTFSKSVTGVLQPESGVLDERALRTDIIADIHTDQNSKQCLEVGTGKLRLMAAAYYNPDGELLVGFGPVLSFHEFRHPMKDRLTDEAWQKMLTSEETTPTGPEWIKNFTAAGK